MLTPLLSRSCQWYEVGIVPGKQLAHRLRCSAITRATMRLRDLDGISDDRARMELALRGVFAGNIFDLGAAESSALFNAKGGVRTECDLGQQRS